MFSVDHRGKEVNGYSCSQNFTTLKTSKNPGPYAKGMEPAKQVSLGNAPVGVPGQPAESISWKLNLRSTSRNCFLRNNFQVIIPFMTHRHYATKAMKLNHFGP